MSRFKIKSLIFMTSVLAGIWLAACKTTPAPSPAAPPQPETREIKDNRRSNTVPSSEAAEAQTPEKSKSGRKTPAAAPAAQQSESPEKSTDRQTASEAAAELRPQETEQRPAKSHKATAQSAAAKLAKARDDLRLSQATERRIASELEALKNSGKASDEDIRNYEGYLERVQAMVAENRRTVAKMEHAYAGHPSGKGNSGEPPKVSDPQIPEEQVQDQVAELDRQLNASLSEFDAMLLKQMETIETESNAKMRDLAQEAADAARRLKEKGVEIDGAESESAGEAPAQGKAEQNEASREKNGAETQPEDGDDASGTSDTSLGKGSGSKGDRESRYSKEDDDIVARQLREAAENETDPELKEKLWQEYEEYKKNTQP
jgi:hypothetical protein